MNKFLLTIFLFYLLNDIFAQSIVKDCNDEEFYIQLQARPYVFNNHPSSWNNSWNMIWNDEFDDHSVFLGNWRFENGAGASTCIYPNTSSTAAPYYDLDVSTGELTLYATKNSSDNQFYSVCLGSDDNKSTGGHTLFSYGYFEARCKLATAFASFPAFWLFGGTNYHTGDPDYCEIDIFEYVGSHEYGSLLGSCVWRTCEIGNPDEDKRIHESVVPTKSTGWGTERGYDAEWITFGVEWFPNSISFYVNNECTHTYRYEWTEVNMKDMHEMMVILNNGMYTWAAEQYEDEGGQFPLHFVIDYVRVYELDKSKINNYCYDFPINGSDEYKLYKKIILAGDGKTVTISSGKHTIWATDEIVLDEGFQVNTEVEFTARTVAKHTSNIIH